MPRRQAGQDLQDLEKDLSVNNLLASLAFLATWRLKCGLYRWNLPQAASLTTVDSRPAGSRLVQLFRPIRQSQLFNERVQISVDHAVQIVGRKSDSVVGEPVLREIVRSDLIASVPAFHH